MPQNNSAAPAPTPESQELEPRYPALLQRPNLSDVYYQLQEYLEDDDTLFNSELPPEQMAALVPRLLELVSQAAEETSSAARAAAISIATPMMPPAPSWTNSPSPRRTPSGNS